MSVPFFEANAGVIEGVIGLTLVNHPAQSLVEIRVTGVGDGSAQVFVCMRTMATDDRAIAFDAGIRRDDTFLQSDHCLGNLEDRTRAILRHQWTVEEWFVRV